MKTRLHDAPPDAPHDAAASPGATASSWLPVAALSAITLLIQGCTVMAMAVYLAPVSRDVGSIGMAATILLLAMALANYPVGWALQKMGPRPVLWAGVALTGAGCLAASQAADRTAMAVAMIVTGLGVGAATIVPGIAVITRRHAARRGLPLAVFLGASVIAGAALPPLIGGIIDAWGWRTAFLLSAMAIALVCTPLVLLVPRGSIARSADIPSRAIIAQASRSADFRRLTIAMTLIQLAINGILFGAVDSLTAQGLNQSDAIAAYSLANLLGLPALMLGGILADRVGARAALIGTALLLAIGTATLLAVQPMGQSGVVAFVLIWGVASALPGQSGSMLLADAVDPQAFAGLLGLNTAIISLVGAAAPACTDQLRQWSGSLTLPVAIYAALSLAAIPLIASVTPRAS